MSHRFQLRIAHLLVLTAVIALQLGVVNWLAIPGQLVWLWFAALALSTLYRTATWQTLKNCKRIEPGERHLIAACVAGIGSTVSFVLALVWVGIETVPPRFLGCVAIGALSAIGAELPFAIFTFTKHLESRFSHPAS